ncbi:EcsC family protein [Methylomagnum sp.]
MNELVKRSPPRLTLEDREALRQAHRHLEYPSFAARLTSKLGAPIEKLVKALPEPWSEGLQHATRVGLERTLTVAIYSLGRHKKKRRTPRSNRYHKTLGLLSGAAGGLFGLPAVVAELPITSTIMLRSIADIARGEGEDLDDPATRLACMEVFALGGRSKDDDAADAGYYGIRLALAMHFTRVSEQVVSQGIVRWNPPTVVRFIADVAARFGVVVTEKAALQMVPILGAGTGSLINLIFMEHFQDIARAHFIMRRLERSYGIEFMRAEYDRLTGMERVRAVR